MDTNVTKYFHCILLVPTGTQQRASRLDIKVISAGKRQANISIPRWSRYTAKSSSERKKEKEIEKISTEKKNKKEKKATFFEAIRS